MPDLSIIDLDINAEFMKRRELLRHLKDNNCILESEGGKYSIFKNLTTEVTTPVTRHNEIADFTVRKICRKLGIPDPN